MRRSRIGSAQEVGLAAKKKNDNAAAGAQVEAAPDPRQALPAGEASWGKVLADLKSVMASQEAPAEPKSLDLFEAMVHIAFGEGLPCGIGQEAERRIRRNFVDRNEFRVTEAYEVEDLLRDLPIPNLFARCLWVRETVGPIYNDQNGLELGFLRDLGVGDRATFFQRLPSMPPSVVAWLNNLLTMEELLFSDKSILRAQQRLGMDPKDAKAARFVDEARALLKPFGHLPITVGKDEAPNKAGLAKPNAGHALCPACCLVRLGPPAKQRR